MDQVVSGKMNYDKGLKNNQRSLVYVFQMDLEQNINFIVKVDKTINLTI